MGAIADKLEAEIHKAQALTSVKTAIHVPAGGLTSLPHGGPVAGMAIAQSPNLDMQISAITACLKSLFLAIKELEDRK